MIRPHRLALALICALFCTAALAQYTPLQLRPEASFTGSCTTGHHGWATDSNKEYRCVASAWVEIARPTIDGAGATNRLPYFSDSDTLTSDADLTWDATSRLTVEDLTIGSDAGFVSSNDAKTLALKVRYYDFDADGDGTSETRWIGDYDGDGTLELEQDVDAAYQSGIALGIRHFVILPSPSWTMTYRDNLTINTAGVVLEGLGRDTTVFTNSSEICQYGPDGAVGGGDDDPTGLDNHDGNGTAYTAIYITAPRVTIRGITMNVGSLRGYFHRDTGYSINDCDNDGTVGQGSPADVEAICGGADATGDGYNDECTSDYHYALTFYNTTDALVEDVKIINSDRCAISFDGTGANAIARNVYIDGNGEHSLRAKWDNVIVEDSTFKNCGVSCILHMGSGSVTDTRITNNHFEDWATHAIWGEAGTSGVLFSSFITHNYMKNTVAKDPSANVDVDADGTLNGYSSAGGAGGECIFLNNTSHSTQDHHIVENTCYLDGPRAQNAIYIPPGASNASKRSVVALNHIYNNTQNWDSDGTKDGTINDNPRSAIGVDAASSIIANNTIEISGDGSASTVNFTERGINFGTTCDYCAAMSNSITGIGDCVIGLWVQGDYQQVIGNTINLTGVTGTCGQNRGIHVNQGTRSTFGNNAIDANVGTAAKAITVGSGASWAFINDNALSSTSTVVSGEAAGSHFIARDNYIHCNNKTVWAYSNNASAVTIIEGGTAHDCYRDGVAGATSVNKGTFLVTDTNSDNTTDTNPQFLLLPNTRLALSGDLAGALKWYNPAHSGTDYPVYGYTWWSPTGCGGTECFVFDFDGDGVIDTDGTDCCILAAGIDPNCDGTP